MLTDNLTYVLRDVDHGIADSVRIAAADRIEALEAWKAEAMEVLRPFAEYARRNQQWLPPDNSELSHATLDAMPTAGPFRAARRLVEKEDGR